MTRKRGRKAKHQTSAQDLHTSKVARTSMAAARTSDDSDNTCAKRRDTDTDSPAAMPIKEHQTEAVGTRVVWTSDPGVSGRGRRGRGRGRGRGSRQHVAEENNTRVRKRTIRQYQWSTVGRDAFNAAQTNTHCSTPDQSSSGSVGTRFERGEGGGVT